jgi:spore germination protein
MATHETRTATKGRTARTPRHGRRRRALLIIVIAGLAIVTGAFLVARAVDEERPHGPYLIGAWTFGDRTSLRRAVAAGAIDEVSVDWLQSRADGSLEAPKYDAGFIRLARKLHRRVFVTLTDYDEATYQFDPAISAAVLADATSRRGHAEAVAAWCRAYHVDGVDVDWEAVKPSQRDRYSKFVADLAEALHRDDRLIAVDVYPKTSEPGGWSGPRAQDWKALGRTVDQFRVMTYNYSGSWSGPGPLSPPAWMDRILDFAETQVAARKIVMGVGLYGRDWRGSKTADLLWGDVERIRKADDPRETRGPSAELSLAYRRNGARHTAFFPDAAAIDAKLHMMLEQHPYIGGVYCWIMGQEDPGAWRVFRRRLH